MDLIQPTSDAIEMLATEIRLASHLNRSGARKNMAALVARAVEYLEPNPAVTDAEALITRAVESFGRSLDEGITSDQQTLDAARSACLEAVGQFRQSLAGCRPTPEARALGLA